MHHKSGRLKSGALLAYASPAIPIAAMGVPVAIYLPPFYAQDMGLGLTVVGVVFMLARIWDVITDPVLGVLSDRFPSRWGRRRHWIALSVPIMVLAAWKLFLPNPDDVTAFYLITWMLIMYIAWTLLSVSHMAWGAELSPQYHERSRIQGVREIAILIGAIGVLGLPAVIEQFNPDNVGAARMASMGWFVIILLPLTVLWAVTKVGERPNHHETPHVSLLASWEIIRHNAEMRKILIGGMFTGVSVGITGGLFLFYASDILQLGQLSSAFLLLNFASGIAIVPIVISISGRFSKHAMLCGCVFLYALSLNLLWFLPPQSPLLTALTMMIMGIYMGSPAFLLRSMAADVIDEDTIKTGHNRTGLFFAIYSMTDKIGNAIAIGFTYIVLDAIGFAPGEVNTAEDITEFKILFIVPSLILNLIIVKTMINFPIDKIRQQKNQQILKDRASTHVSTSPESRTSLSYVTEESRP
ncbi:MFS transporter [Maricurvus nonylphenolicus]|uniref:MFS transporter n=1 Tax=Maricurvus nonylphenolicus TaxID=1008307 RepID=UPI0036F2A769